VKKNTKIIEVSTIDTIMEMIKTNIKYYNVNNFNYRKFLTEYGIKEL